MKRMISTILSLLVLTGTFACTRPANGGEEPPRRETDAIDSHPTSTDTESTSTSGTDIANPTHNPFDPQALKTDGEKSPRWLSLPDSRLVVNPLPFSAINSETTHAEYSNSPEMPLHLGYLDPYSQTSDGVWLEKFLILHEGSASGGIETLWNADLSSAAKWEKSGGDFTEVQCDNQILSVKVLTGAPEPWQYASQKVTLDIRENTTVTITVDACEGTWALKFCPDGKGDIALQGDTSKTGTFTYDLGELTGLDGKVRGVLKIFAIGTEKALHVSRLDIGRIEGARTSAVDYTTEWTPYSLPFVSTYPDGLAIEGVDTFADTETVIRRIRATKAGVLSIGGILFGTPVSYSEGKLNVECSGYSYSIVCSQPQAVKFYHDYPAYMAGTDIVATKDETYTYYGFEPIEMTEGDEVVFVISLASNTKSVHDLEQLATANATPAAAERALKDSCDYWTDYLARVPRPSDFALNIVDKLGVTAEETERMYYIAWVFIAQNILPANTELGFNYRQVACGKPSMWGAGHPLNMYSASWESFYGMMCLGYVLPDLAWDAYIGMMSLVDEEGMLAGESLPSEKAHTAYVLYNLTGDKDKLNAVYDNIARYLQWRVENPRWIYVNVNDPNSVDADFAESALIDLKYMMEIAAITGRDGDVPLWQELYDQLLTSYRIWFFDEDGNAYQYCGKANLNRTEGNTLWVTKGLYIAELEDKYETMLINRFNRDYKPTSSFGGFNAVKYPDSSHTIYGLINRGYTDTAATMIELCMRDVMRAGIFAESYDGGAQPISSGVRPSIFGCAMLIDAVLATNGFMYETGLPKAVNLGMSGSVSNIHIQGEVYAIAVDSETNRLLLTVGNEKTECELPKGETKLFQ